MKNRFRPIKVIISFLFKYSNQSNRCSDSYTNTPTHGRPSFLPGGQNLKKGIFFVEMALSAKANFDNPDFLKRHLLQL